MNTDACTMVLVDDARGIVQAVGTYHVNGQW